MSKEPVKPVRLTYNELMARPMGIQPESDRLEHVLTIEKKGKDFVNVRCRVLAWKYPDTYKVTPGKVLLYLKGQGKVSIEL